MLSSVTDCAVSLTMEADATQSSITCCRCKGMVTGTGTKLGTTGGICAALLTSLRGDLSARALASGCSSVAKPAKSSSAAINHHHCFPGTCPARRWRGRPSQREPPRWAHCLNSTSHAPCAVLVAGRF